jgi:hypothetical protein
VTVTIAPRRTAALKHVPVFISPLLFGRVRGRGLP